MKKICIFLMLASILLLSGCGGETERIFYPAGNDVELYYDSYPEVRTQIKREDIKRGNYYDDIFLADGIKSGMTIKEVGEADVYAKKREAMLYDNSAVKEEMPFVPGATGNTKLTEWINRCNKIRYTFDKKGIVSTYELTNKNNTYVDYLYVMRALSLKYGECTTEIYKDGDNIINNTKIREDYKGIEGIVRFYEREFEGGNVQIISQWVEDEYVLSVEFLSPLNARIVYQMNKDDSAEETPEKNPVSDENEPENEEPENEEPTEN